MIAKINSQKGIILIESEITVEDSVADYISWGNKTRARELFSVIRNNQMFLDRNYLQTMSNPHSIKQNMKKYDSEEKWLYYQFMNVGKQLSSNRETDQNIIGNIRKNIQELETRIKNQQQEPVYDHSEEEQEKKSEGIKDHPKLTSVKKDMGDGTILHGYVDDKHNLLQGKATLYDKNGEMIKTYEFKDGKLHGKVIEYMTNEKGERRERKMKVYDKAKWHIESGLDKEKVISFFKELFSWLNKNDLLSEEGVEILNFGIDSEISLHSRLLNNKGNEIINESYDDFLKENKLNPRLIKPYFDKVLTNYEN